MDLPANQIKIRYRCSTDHVAVWFEDNEVSEVRQQLRDCLAYMGELLPRAPKDFHFVDIYNGYGEWKPFKEDKRNLRLFEAFASIYASYRWPVMVQTVDVCFQSVQGRRPRHTTKTGPASSVVRSIFKT